MLTTPFNGNSEITLMDHPLALLSLKHTLFKMFSLMSLMKSITISECIVLPLPVKFLPIVSLLQAPLLLAILADGVSMLLILGQLCLRI